MAAQAPPVRRRIAPVPVAPSEAAANLFGQLQPASQGGAGGLASPGGASNGATEAPPPGRRMKADITKEYVVKYQDVRGRCCAGFWSMLRAGWSGRGAECAVCLVHPVIGPVFRVLQLLKAAGLDPKTFLEKDKAPKDKVPKSNKPFMPGFSPMGKDSVRLCMRLCGTFCVCACEGHSVAAS